MFNPLVDECINRSRVHVGANIQNFRVNANIAAAIIVNNVVIRVIRSKVVTDIPGIEHSIIFTLKIGMIGKNIFMLPVADSSANMLNSSICTPIPVKHFC